jgi:hypothetical protein
MQLHRSCCSALRWLISFSLDALSFLWQNYQMKAVAQIGAVMAFALCFLGGALILTVNGLDTSKDHVVWTAMGLYFIGKAFFVGPMLFIVAERLYPKRES